MSKPAGGVELRHTGIITVLDTTDRSGWEAVLERCPDHDYYHLHGYHVLAERRGEGEARLFRYTNGEYTIAVPLLLRPISSVPGLQDCGEGWHDATSVYGYCGPIASHADVPGVVIADFCDALTTSLQALNVVCTFSRLHPLLPQERLLSGMGECSILGQTISINLTLPPDQQRAGYRKGNLYDVRRLGRDGMVCVRDDTFEHFETFIELYHCTMKRVGASSYYLFDRSYFEALRDALGSRMHLFVTQLRNDVTCAGLFIECGGILQYHLSGTAEGYSKLASTKLLLDSVRQWASERGLREFHLGGGVGGSQDSLFFFKAGFSHRRHDFRVWRWILQPDVYKVLSTSRREWRSTKDVTGDTAGFFPAYRA